MAILIRCKACKCFVALKNATCTCCKSDIKKGEKDYYIQYKLHGKIKFEYAGNSLIKAKEIEARVKLERRVSDLTEYNVPAPTLSMNEFINKHFIPNFLSRTKNYRAEKGRIDAIRKYFGVYMLKDVTPLII